MVNDSIADMLTRIRNAQTARHESVSVETSIMKKSIAQILEVDETQIFVKAKTGEKLGEIGNGLAVAVWATCLLYQNSQE